MRIGPSGGSQGNPLGVAIVGALTILVVVVVLAVACGCSKPPVRGTVTHKQHSDAYTYITTTCGAYDSKMRCTMYVTHWNSMPATWEICVTGVDEDGKNASDCIEVGEYSWRAYREGDEYPKNVAAPR